VDHAGPSAVLPLRPLTVGEVLDAAVTILRDHARGLLPVAAVLAAAEQLALAPVRRWAHANPPGYLPEFDDLGRFWPVLVVGAATEAFVLCLLGGPASRAAGATLLGQRLSVRALLDPRGARLPAVLLVALAAAGIVFVAALGGPLWAVGYGLVGLAVPALILDRVAPLRALWRGVALALRGGMRAMGIRLLGGGIWLALRVALALGGITALEAVGLGNPAWSAVIGALTWSLANAVAYPTLACLDAVLHLDTRMRTEGLDIRLSRAGVPLRPSLLAVDR